jgi:hypothetical protein
MCRAALTVRTACSPNRGIRGRRRNTLTGDASIEVQTLLAADNRLLAVRGLLLPTARLARPYAMEAADGSWISAPPQRWASAHRSAIPSISCSELSTVTSAYVRTRRHDSNDLLSVVLR